MPSQRASGPSDQDPTLRLEDGSPLPSRLASAAPTLAPGQVLAGRFRIIGFLGRGGMGEVYEAQDEELSERVALKTIRGDIAAEPGALDRFRREINLARRVTHGNVSRIYDLWRHRPESDGGLDRPVTFLTMELLAGETLAERLKRGGRLSTAEALPLLSQIGAGLAAAHRAGVVHRDFKSANVMLVPEAGGMRAVVTDFGLARAAQAQSAAYTLTGKDFLVGSPPYMAPEQVTGDEVGTATDVYALGVVAYEMVTGALPFEADSAFAAAAKRLTEPPTPPRKRVPDLDRRWEAAILRCLARRPEDRFESPQAVVEALEAAAPGPAVPGSGERRRTERRPGERRRGLPLAAAAAGIALLSGLGWALLWGPLSPGPGTADGPPARPVGERQAVAVVGMRNLSGDPQREWLSTALAELLTSNLAAGTGLRTVPRETVTKAEIELGLPSAGSLAAATLGRLRGLLGCDFVVVGSFLPLSGSARLLQVDLSLQEATTGATRAAFSERGGEEELPELVAQVGERLRSELGVRGAAPLAARLATVEATRRYAEGLASLREFEPAKARELLEQAVAADPASPLAHAALASSWQALGYEQRAAEEAKRAFDLAAAEPWESRQLLEGRYRAAVRAWPEAIALYDNLWAVFRDNIEYGLLLAEAQTGAGRGAEALATVAEMKALPEPAGADPRIDLVEAEAAQSLAELDRQLEAARRAIAKGEQLGARLLLARGRQLEGAVAERRGEFAAAKEAYREGTRLAAAAGDRVGEARALQNMAIVLAKEGNLAGSRDLLAGVLATYRETGSRADEARALSNLGTLSRLQGDPEGALRLSEEALGVAREIHDRRGEARELNSIAILMKSRRDLAGAANRYREALEIWRAIGDRAESAAAMSNLGNVYREEGKLAEARTMFDAARGVFAELGDRLNAAATVSNLAEIAAQEGDGAAAERLHREALATYREIGASPGVAAELTFLGRVAGRRADVAEAEKNLREAISLLEAAGAGGGARGTRLELASLLIAAGDPGAAAPVARRAADEASAARDGERQAVALALLALAEAGLGRLDSAEIIAARAGASLPERSRPESRLTVSLAGARVQAALGRVGPAVETLGRLAGQARSAGLDELELEARLARGSIELAARIQEAGAGRPRLAAVESEAREKGLELIARRAAAALGR